MLALWFLFLPQSQLELSTSVDRSRVAVGEEVHFTLKAVGHSTAPFRVEVPALDGLTLVDRSERTDVVVGTTQTTRVFTLELHLRADQVGTWPIGPFRVEQGEASVFTSVETVAVTSASSGGSSGLDPDLLALIPRVPPPRPGTPSVYLVASGDRVYAGDQVNLLTAAWLPRGLRLRLRQPPTLTPPSLSSVWVTPRSSVAGAVASRIVDGEVYDLYVSFQSAYPLNPGSLTIPPARLAWVQPSSRPTTSEMRQSVESAPLLLSVRPVADAGRPAAFDGPVARNLSIAYELGASSGRAGVALPVTIVVSGAGNLPLWPAPNVAWPSTVRVYQEGSEGAPHQIGGRLGGRKQFRFGVVPDSAGSLTLPAIDYPYFDPGSGAGMYRTAHAPAIVVPVLEPPPVTDRRNPLPVYEPEYRTFVERMLGLPPVALASLVLIPLLGITGVTLWRRRTPVRPRAPAPAAAPERLEALFRTVIPPGTPATPRALIAALRDAGVDRQEAERLVQLHLALEAGRFGPDAVGEAAEVTTQVESALAKLPRRMRRLAGAAAVGLLVALPPGRAEAQSGLELYARGNYPAAARAFRAEGEVSLPTAGRWYDLAAAEYLARHDAEAVAALLPARALAPRDPRIRALWQALGREHEQLRRAGRAWPVSAEEAFALALAGLWLGAILLVAFRRARPLWIGSVSFSLVMALMGQELRAERGGHRAVLTGGVSLRTSPHGLAPERGALPGFTVVYLEKPLGSWWLVRTADGAEGWVPAGILAPSPALD